MWKEQLAGYTIILGSTSPRRQQFLKELALDFEVRTQAVEEVYPPHLNGTEISDFLCRLKAESLSKSLANNEILITSDTVVWHKNKALGKPVDAAQAFDMLSALSNDWHEVMTSVCFTTPARQIVVNHTTEVKFKALTADEIWFYINEYKPFDKAGGYGIQEWIGLIGIETIQGSHANVVGLPTHLVYKTLMDMVG